MFILVSPHPGCGFLQTVYRMRRIEHFCKSHKEKRELLARESAPKIITTTMATRTTDGQTHLFFFESKQWPGVQARACQRHEQIDPQKNLKLQQQ